MKDAKLVLVAEFEADADQPRQWDPRLVELLRGRADELAREQGGTIRLDREPLIEVRQGEHVLLPGRTFWLVYSEWSAMVPEDVEVNTGRPA